jgi:hypothetical protein
MMTRLNGTNTTQAGQIYAATQNDLHYLINDYTPPDRGRE